MQIQAPNNLCAYTGVSFSLKSAFTKIVPTPVFPLFQESAILLDAYAFVWITVKPI